MKTIVKGIEIEVLEITQAVKDHRNGTYYVGRIKVGKNVYDFELSWHKDDGSIKRNIGKVYASIQIGGSMLRTGNWDGNSYWTCPSCKETLGKPLFKLFKPFIEEKSKKKICTAKWFGDGSGWWTFYFNESEILPNSCKTVGTRRCSEEVVTIYLEHTAKCPIHGKIQVQDTDVAD